MDAKATARYLARNIDRATKEAQEVRAEVGEILATPLTRGSRATSSHALDRLIEAEAVAVAWLEIQETAGGTLEEVGTDTFLKAVHSVRAEINKWLRTSRYSNTGTLALQALAAHNASIKVLSSTDVVEIIDADDN